MEEYDKGECFDCENKFVCVYGINRNHKSHSRDTLANQAVSTRNRPNFDWHCNSLVKKPSLNSRRGSTLDLIDVLN